MPSYYYCPRQRQQQNQETYTTVSMPVCGVSEGTRSQGTNNHSSKSERERRELMGAGASDAVQLKSENITKNRNNQTVLTIRDDGKGRDCTLGYITNYADNTTANWKDPDKIVLDGSVSNLSNPDHNIRISKDASGQRVFTITLSNATEAFRFKVDGKTYYYDSRFPPSAGPSSPATSRARPDTVATPTKGAGDATPAVATAARPLASGPSGQKAAEEDKVQGATSGGENSGPITMAPVLAAARASRQLQLQAQRVVPVKPVSPVKTQPIPPEPENATTPRQVKAATKLTATLSKVDEALPENRAKLGRDSTVAEAESALQDLNKDYKKLKSDLKAYETACKNNPTPESKALIKRGNDTLEACLKERRTAAELMITPEDPKAAARGKAALVAMSDDIHAVYDKKISNQPVNNNIARQSLKAEKSKFQIEVDKFISEGHGGLASKVDDFVTNNPRIKPVVDLGRKGGEYLSRGKDGFIAAKNMIVECTDVVATLKKLPSRALSTSVAIYEAATTGSVLTRAKDYLSGLEATDAKPVAIKDLNKLDSGLAKRESYLEGSKKAATPQVQEELTGIKEARSKLAVKAHEILSPELEAAKLANTGPNATAKTAATLAAVEDKIYGKWGAQIEGSTAATESFKAERAAHTAKTTAATLDKELASFRSTVARDIHSSEAFQSAERAHVRAQSDANTHTKSALAQAEVEVRASKLRIAELEAIHQTEGIPDKLKDHVGVQIEAENAKLSQAKELADRGLVADIENADKLPLETKKYITKASFATELTDLRDDLAQKQERFAVASDADKPAALKEIRDVEAKIAKGEWTNVNNATLNNQEELKLIAGELKGIDSKLANTAITADEFKDLNEARGKLVVKQNEANAMKEMLEAQEDVLFKNAEVAAKRVELEGHRVGGTKAAPELAAMEAEIDSLHKTATKMQSQLDSSLRKKLADAELNFRKLGRAVYRNIRHPVEGTKAGVKATSGALVERAKVLDKSMLGKGWEPSFGKMAAATIAVEGLARVAGADYSPEVRHTAMPQLIVWLNRKMADWDIDQGQTTADSGMVAAVARESISAVGDTALVLRGGQAILGAPKLAAWAANTTLAQRFAGTRVGMASTRVVMAGTRLGAATANLPVVNRVAPLLSSPLFGSVLSGLGAGYGGYQAFKDGQFMDMNFTQTAATSGGYIASGALGGTICGGPVVGAAIGATGGAVGELYAVMKGLASLDEKIEDNWIKRGATETLERGIYGLAKPEAALTQADKDSAKENLKDEEKEIINHFALVKLLPTILGEESTYSQEERNQLSLMRAPENATDAQKEEIGSYNWERISALVNDGKLEDLDAKLVTKVNNTLQSLKDEYTDLYVRSYKKEYENKNPHSTWADPYLWWGTNSTEKGTLKVADQLHELTSKMESQLSDRENAELFDIEEYFIDEKVGDWKQISDNPILRDALLQACWAMDENGVRKLVNPKAYERFEDAFDHKDNGFPVEDYITSAELER